MNFNLPQNSNTLLHKEFHAHLHNCGKKVFGKNDFY